jgi:Spy/CpxP family protein refolding chaperone
MRHQSELKLTEDQRKFIIATVQEAQNNFTEWKWSLQSEMEKMGALTAGEKVDEAQVLAQLEKVLALEKQIKIQQLKMMISIKNKLNTEQQKKLTEIKSTFVGKRDGPPRPDRK